MLRRALAYAALLCVIAASAPAALPQTNLSPLIRVGTGTDDQSVPLLYADKAGLYKKYGLNVQIVKVPGAAAVAAALAGGSLEIGKGSPTGAITAVAKGLPFVVIGAISFWDSARPDNGLIVGAAGPIKDAKDLSGKTLAAVTLGDLTTLATFAWLEARGVDPATIKWTELPASAVAGAIDQGRIAGSTVYEPYFTADLNGGKVRLLGYPYDALGKRFANAVLFANGSWANEHADLVAKFLHATQEAATYIAAHGSEVAPLMAEFGGIDPATLANIRHPERGVPIEPSDLQPVIDAAAKYNVIPKAFPAATLICSCALR
ncbi:MAG: ABC transporter substrate-binding protein [Candidatus Lustribacter sp.]